MIFLYFPVFNTQLHSWELSLARGWHESRLTAEPNGKVGEDGLLVPFIPLLFLPLSLSHFPTASCHIGVHVPFDIIEFVVCARYQ